MRNNNTTTDDAPHGRVVVKDLGAGCTITTPRATETETDAEAKARWARWIWDRPALRRVWFKQGELFVET